jgi:hypothetical protein
MKTLVTLIKMKLQYHFIPLELRRSIASSIRILRSLGRFQMNLAGKATNDLLFVDFNQDFRYSNTLNKTP